MPMPFLSSDYNPGRPQHNARVFLDLWSHWPIGVDDEGLFESSDGSAGTQRFRDIVDAIQRTDGLHKLTRVDAEEAAAMLWHFTPALDDGMCLEFSVADALVALADRLRASK